VNVGRRRRIQKIELANGEERVTTYGWDSKDRLREVVLPSGGRVRFTYDAFGRRVRKDVLRPPSDLTSLLAGRSEEKPQGIAQRSVQFLWEGDVLCEEQDANTGERLRKRVHVHEPGTYVPMLQAEEGDVFGVVTDHLGMPTELLDRGGRVVWRATHSAWGVAEVQPNPGKTTVESPFRLLGQYLDEETGLCSTRFRYFDATTGRWLSPDPLQISGGFNLSGFDGAPTVNVDPLGLLCKRAIRDAIAAIRAGKDVRVRTVEDARQILENMPELKPHTFDRRTPVPDNEGGHSNPLWRQPDGTWRADLINKNEDPETRTFPSTAPIHPDLPEGHEHRDFPHYNIRTPDGTKAAIIVTG
jgi:RHS repeat-associated protein